MYLDRIGDCAVRRCSCRTTDSRAFI